MTCTCDLCFVPASCFPIFSDESDTCIFHSHLFTRRKSFPGESSDHMKKDRDAPFVQLRGINYWFWAHLKCTGHNSFFCTFFFALRISNVSLQVLTSLNKGSLHNRPFIDPTEANAIRKKCRVRLAWLIKRQLCRLKQRFQYLSKSWMSPLATTALRG